MKAEIGINPIIHPDARPKLRQERLDQGLEEPLNTRKDHPCRMGDGVIPSKSPAFLTEKKELFEMIDGQAKRLEQAVIKREYRHYPNCENPIIEQQLNLPDEE